MYLSVRAEVEEFGEGSLSSGSRRIPRGSGREGLTRGPETREESRDLKAGRTQRELDLITP